MKRKFNGLIFLACFTIIVLSFVNFSIAKTVKGKKSNSKVDSVAKKDKGKKQQDCVKNYIRCCKNDSCKKASKIKHCKKPLCTELACKGKKCGDVCNVSHWKEPGKCTKRNKCSKKVKNPKCGTKDCKGKKCGEICQHPESNVGVFVCNKKERCVDIIENPCSVHGCKGKKCGDECLMGDIMGYCNESGDCKSQKTDDCGPKPKKCRNNKQCEAHERCHRGICLPVPDGRPFVVDGRYRATTSLIGKIDESNVKTAWNIDQIPGILANSSVNQEIAGAFSNQGEGEHASVASFARHTLQLMNMGAPSTLLIGSQKAALDEIKHAKMCYGIAKAFLGAKIQPNTLDIDGSVKTMSKREIIQSVITEGCIGETVAAVRAQLSAHYAKDQIVKGILKEIAVDETNHSQLAWNTVQWAINRFPELRSIAEKAFKAQLDRPMEMANRIPTEYCYDCDKESALHDHGLLLDTDKETTVNLGIQNVIEPVVLNEFLNVDTISTQVLNMDFSSYQ